MRVSRLRGLISTLFVLSLVLWPERSYSQNRSASGVAAVVKSDSALIYSKPDFDADVLGTLNAGQHVRVSKGTTGSVVKFHKVRAGSIVGYVAESDVAVEGETKRREAKSDNGPSKTKASSASKNKTKTNNKKKSKESKKRNEDKEKFPMLFSRFVGVMVGQVGFKEGISGVDATDNFLVYGLKVTGPDVLLDGPIMDLNVALHFGAPSYYNSLSTTKPTGFVLLTDGLFLLPFIQAQDQMVYFGAGPLLVLSNFKVTNGGAPQDLTALNLGVSFSVGAGLRFDKVALRLEGKYYIEKQSYRGLQLSLQSQF